MADRAVEEFASDDGSADVFGPNGSLVPNVAFTSSTTSRLFTVQTTIQNTDFFSLEISEATGRAFLPVGTAYPFVQGNNANGLNHYGVRLRISGSTFEVEFGNRGQRVSVSNVDNGNTQWSDLFAAGARFRLRKVSGGAAVGYPIGARNVIGDVSGTAVPAGFIGESVTGNLSSVVNVSTTTNAATDVTGATLPLTPGVFLFSVSVGLRQTAAVGSPDMRLVIRDAAGSTIASREYNQGGVLNVDMSVSIIVPVIVTSAQTYKLSIFQEGGTSGTTAVGTNGGFTYFNAVRIA